jgi:O-antigen biosynthesis protein
LICGYCVAGVGTDIRMVRWVSLACAVNRSLTLGALYPAVSLGDLSVPVARISAFVICFNRADVLATCLRALRFADELIVIDKSSTDGSHAIAQDIADRVMVVPWTPTVEETRALALSLCQHDWILFMDDDECLSAGAGRRIRAELENPRAAIYEFALRHYILGCHDERAYYWPEHHVRLFRRGAVSFRDTIHAGITRHFSNADVAGWIEKANRYTANPDRDGIVPGPEGLAAFGHQRIDHWFGRTGDEAVGGYPSAAALLRAVYDMVDGLKSWEAARGLDGGELLRQACARQDLEQVADRDSTAEMLAAADLRLELAAAERRCAALSADCAALSADCAALSAARVAAEQCNDTLSADQAAIERRNETLVADLARVAASNLTLSADLVLTQGDAEALREMLGAVEQRIGELETSSAEVGRRLAAVQASTSWRLTAGLRRLMTVVRGR